MPDTLDLDQILDAALAHHEAGQLDQAEAGYRTVLQHDPDVLDALNLLGVILQERGNVAEAIPLFTHAVAVDPEFTEAWTSLASAHRIAGAPEQAADAARRATALDPDMAVAFFQLGGALIDLGAYAEAVEALRRTIALVPGAADALVSLGIALIGLNNLSEAAASFDAALKLDPRMAAVARALTHLARAHRAAGNPTAAIEATRRALAVDPTFPDAHVQLGYALLDRQDDTEAAEVLRDAVKVAPHEVEAQIAYATVLTRQKDHASAAEAWQAAIALKPGEPGLLVNLATSLTILKRYAEALAMYRQAEALAPGYPEAQFGIANALARDGDIAGAAEMCRRVLQSNPDQPRFWQLLANWDLMLGHFDAAADAYRHLLTLEPDSAIALNALVGLPKKQGDKALWDMARAILDDPTRPIQSRVTAGFALGQLYEQSGAYDDAFEAFAAANKLMRDHRVAEGFIVDRDRTHAMIDWLIAAFGPQTFAAAAGWGNPSELPVFIVGMPRSGTSLVEQIAASHPLVFGAGERMDIPEMLQRLNHGQQVCVPSGWDQAAIEHETTAHVEMLHALGGDATRVIDKLPFNILWLGQIAVLFPHARIIVCRRDQRDVGLSCFFQNFHDDNMEWTNDLADCGFRARENDRIIAHWLKVLPIPILEVRYETLIENPERESRRLIEFLGLEWDPACLSFHKTERAVATASYWQVRQPIYASSIGRWRHYERHLGPFLQEFEASEASGEASAAALIGRADAYRLVGDFNAAVEAARQALVLDPTHPGAHVQLGYALLARQDDVEAAQVLRHATGLAPGSLEAHTGLATALTRLQEHDGALAAWRTALALKPNDFNLLLGLAASLRERHNFHEALSIYRQAGTLTPDHRDVQHGTIVCLLDLHEIEAATELCRQALETTPDSAPFWLLLATCETMQGNSKSAIHACRQALAVDPASAIALHTLSSLGETIDAGAAQNLLNDQSRTADDRIAAGFALGQELDRRHAYDEAFEAYATANRLLRANRAAALRVFDRNRFRDLIDQLIATFTPEMFAETAGSGDPSELPVFVVGMPRSGTSLVEQIAASHPLVFGAGERQDLFHIFTALNGQRQIRSPAAWDRSAILRETALHLQVLRDLGGEAVRVIDKTPDNIGNLGQIAVLFPRAHIVLCRRDLRDVCLSCFQQYFPDDTMIWADDLADCAFRARQIDRLVDHWRKVLPNPILEIDYETLAGNLESESRRLIDFLGLEWDPACLSFHQTQRPVATASHQQVRRPIYTSSVGRWRRYGRNLEPLLRELETLDPVETDSAAELAHRAHVYRTSGDPGLAVHVARRAVDRDPALPDTQVELGCALLDSQDNAEAAEVLGRAVDMAPQSSEAQVAFATALDRLENHDAASDAWQAALALRPDDPTILIGFARSLAALEHYEEALATYRQAEALLPGYPLARYGVADALYHLGDVAAAAALSRELVKIKPEWSVLWYLLATSETVLGRFEAAAEAHRRTLALDPKAAGALHDLVALGKQVDDDALTVAARKIVDDQSRPLKDRALAGYALGRLADRRGTYGEAFEAYLLANRLMKADRTARGFVFDQNTFHGVVDKLIEDMNPDLFAEAQGWGDPSELPVFIVGMPRSGTSLVEQIATSHPLVFGAGELKDIPHILTVLDSEELPGGQTGWTRTSVQRETTAHLEHLQALGGDAIRVIDKLPDNVGVLGQIAMLFPGARVIITRRDMRDVCVSCFFQYFYDDATMWSDNLADCGSRAREVDRLMDHWLKVLPIKILEVQYETLVANLESESRRLIDFLGLDWDPACLSFHKTERSVTTASHWQVRQPVYSSSVGRWRRYEPYLGPLLQALEGSPPAR